MGWNLTGNVRGPQGAQGLKGDKGDMGPAGTSGGGDRGLKPTGVIAHTIPRTSPMASLALLTSAREHLAAIWLNAGDVVTNITFVSTATAMATPTNWWFALRDKDRNLIQQSADQLIAGWAANTVKTLGLILPHTCAYTGWYYLGLMVKATTVPTIAGVSGIIPVLGMAPVASGFGATGLSTTAPSTSTIGVVSAMPYGAVS